MSRIADDVFMLILDERSGQPRAAAKIAGLVVASGLLAELVDAGCLVVRQGLVGVTDARPPPDALALQVHTLICERLRDHPEARTWLDCLSRGAVALVAERLAGDGALVVGRRRRLTGSRSVHHGAYLGWARPRVYAAIGLGGKSTSLGSVRAESFPADTTGPAWL